MPNTDLRIVTNGVLIPSMSDTFLEYFRQNQIIIEISMYPPTVKMFDKIKETLQKNNIPYFARPPVNEFNVFLTLRGDHNPFQARQVCCNDICRFMRDGKIYKCPVDALSYKYTSHFGVRNFPKSTGVDIYANNFATLVEMLDGNIELCSWCNETAHRIPWKATSSSDMNDWLA